MSISRRDLLKGAVVAGATAVVAGKAEGREPVEPSPDAVGMLFDATLCVGCRACQTACKAANKLPADKVEANGGVYDAPNDLNGTTKNIIKAFEANGQSVFQKQQCMHCVDPSCVSVCMLGALHKEGQGKRDMGGEKKGTGIVIYDKGLCVGCRYCQIGCAFNVPKFEWYEAFPLIVKCELCRQRRDEKKSGPLAIANPACCEVCPREAVIYGRREDLLKEAKRRLAADPKRYNGHVFGEKEGGGTQVLYLAPASVTFKQLGMPELGEESQAEFSESVSHAPYLHGVTPIALYAAMAFVITRNKKKEEAAEHEKEGR
ncbi:MAG TPA: hydrogenase 2 operon protein HybA [Anaeromyxobacter sp.]|nr:hydrogenase 2 operon protein HybA [Anaeromyxobacter sp.]